MKKQNFLTYQEAVQEGIITDDCSCPVDGKEEEWKEYKEVLHNSLFSYEEVGTFQEFLK